MSEGKEDGVVFNVTTLYGFKTRQALVRIDVPGEFTIQIPPEDAEALAANLFAAAQASRTDAFLFEFIVKDLGLTEQNAAMMLAAFREWRQQ